MRYQCSNKYPNYKSCDNKNLLLIIFVLVITACDSGTNTDNPGGTPTQNNVRFVAIGDVGTGSADQMKVAKAIENRCASDGCDFAILLGDNFYNNGVGSIDDQQFEAKYEIPYGSLGFPFYVVLGNHDYGGNGAGIDYARSLFQLDYASVSSTWKMPHHYYNFNYSNAEFFALDTNAQMFGLDENQQTNISNWINDSDSNWKVAFGHHPYMSNGPHGNAGKYEGISGIPIVSGKGVKEFAEATWCGSVDLYISGHDHSRQWLDVTCRGTQLAVSGAGAKTTELPGNNPSLFQEATIGFLYIVITGSTLNAYFINGNNEIEFSHQISK